MREKDARVDVQDEKVPVVIQVSKELVKLPIPNDRNTKRNGVILVSMRTLNWQRGLASLF